MADAAHPFFAVAEQATAKGLKDLKLIAENDGAYVRLVSDDPALLFKRKSDPRDSLDRTGFGGHKRITLEEEDFENGPAATLQTILSYLKHFEGWHAQTPHSKP